MSLIILITYDLLIWANVYGTFRSQLDVISWKFE